MQTFNPKSLFGADEARLSEVAAEAGQPRYRGRQLFEAMYRSRITSFDEISNLPKDFRLRLKEQGYSILRPSISRQFQSTDGTIRYLVEMNDGESVETVWMPKEMPASREMEVKPERKKSGRARRHFSGRRFAFPARWDAP